MKSPVQFVIILELQRQWGLVDKEHGVGGVGVRNCIRRNKETQRRARNTEKCSSVVKHCWTADISAIRAPSAAQSDCSDF